MTSLAGVSIDVDSVASHLNGYGRGDSDDVASVYEKALPRAAEIFLAQNIRATFFLPAQEAEQFAPIVRELVRRGHEIACHSYTHPIVRDGRWAPLRERELVYARELLEKISGERVVGFRAPGWCGSQELLRLLPGCGYEYDASFYPSWFLLVVRAMLGRGYRHFLADLQNALTSAQVRLITEKPKPFVEIPLSCSPILRFPYYHTLKVKLPRGIFRIIRQMAHTRQTPIHYVLHAVDFLSLSDVTDKRIVHHPGMELDLTAKLDLIVEELVLLRAQREVVPYKEIARSVALDA